MRHIAFKEQTFPYEEIYIDEISEKQTRLYTTVKCTCREPACLDTRNLSMSFDQAVKKIKERDDLDIMGVKAS